MADLRDVAEWIDGLERGVLAHQHSPQAGFTAFPDRLDQFDEEGNRVGAVGLLPDGTFGVQPVVPVPPPAPTAPIVECDLNQVGVSWNGMFADEDGDGDPDVVEPSTLSHIAVFSRYLGTLDGPAGEDGLPSLVPAEDEPDVARGSIAYTAQAGGQLSFGPVVETGLHEVWLCAVGSDGGVSVPSGRARFEVTYGLLQGELDEVRLRADGAMLSADGKNSVWRQDSAPVPSEEFPISEGDIWFHTGESNMPHVWDGSGWVSAADERVTAVQDAVREFEGELNDVRVSADGKNKTFFQSTMPATPPARAGDLWFNTANGMRLHRHDGATFVEVSDGRISELEGAVENIDVSGPLSEAREEWLADAAADALAKAKAAADAAEAAAKLYADAVATGAVEGELEGIRAYADQAAEAARQAAIEAAVAQARVVADAARDEALAAALDADVAISQSVAQFESDLAVVRESADGKSKITWSPNAPSGDGKAGDTWFRMSSNRIIGHWRHSGSSWVSMTFDATVIPNLDAGKITSGTIDAARIGAGAITAEKISAGAVGATAIAAESIDAGKIQAGAIGAKQLAAKSITADKLVSGTITAESGVIGSLDLGKATVGELDGARIKAKSVRADAVLVPGSAGSTVIANGAVTTEKIATGSITAESGVIGSLDLGKATVGQLNGDRIKANSISSDHIRSGAVTATSLAADAINGKTITGATVQTSTGYPRVAMDKQGLHAWDQAGRRTLHVDQGTGEVSVVGEFMTGRDGQPRVKIDPDDWVSITGVDEDGNPINMNGAGIAIDGATGRGLSIYHSAYNRSSGGGEGGAAVLEGPGRQYLYMTDHRHTWLRQFGSGANARSELYLWPDSGRLSVHDNTGSMLSTLLATNEKAEMAAWSENRSGRITVIPSSITMKTREVYLDSHRIEFSSALSNMGQFTYAGPVANWGIRYYKNGEWFGEIGSPSGTKNTNDFGMRAVGRSISFVVESGGHGHVFPGHLTGSSGGQAYLDSAGVLRRSTSSRRTKLNISDISQEIPELDDKILSLSAHLWHDKVAVEEYSAQLTAQADGDDYAGVVQDYPLKRVPGMIAEDVLDAGLEEFVLFDSEGNVDGLMYDRLGVALIPVVARLRDRIEALEAALAAQK